MVPLFCAASLAAALPMRAYPPRPSGTTSKRFVLPTLAVLALVAFGLGAELLEGASRVWATIYIRDAFDVPAMVESSALPALILSMAVARLLADGIIDRYGPRSVAAAALTIAIIGLGIVVFANNAYVAVFGFGVAGLGASVIYPLMISAAARLGDRPASENVAALTVVVQLVLLVSPAAIGAAAEGLGVRAAFALLLPLLLVGLIVSRQLR
jgi:MFS family permease